MLSGLAFQSVSSAPVIAGPDLPAGDLPKGRVLLWRLAQDPRQEYFLYVPRLAGAGARVLVTVHGISRNAREQVRLFRRFADHHGFVVVGPLFPRARYPDYQSLGWLGKGRRSDLALQKILDEVSRLTHADVDRVYLFGYSGGGQFVHRYAMAYPRQVAAVAIGAAGWYTFPDPSTRYARGLKTGSTQQGLRLEPAEFLKVPMAVFVGERDFRHGLEFKQSRALNSQQGLSRIERGHRWVKAMEAAAKERRISTRYEFYVLPRAGHSFAASMKRGGLGERVFKFLLDASHLAASKTTGGEESPPAIAIAYGR